MLYEVITVLILGVLVIAFPLYVAFVASTLPYEDIVAVPMSYNFV